MRFFRTRRGLKELCKIRADWLRLVAFLARSRRQRLRMLPFSAAKEHWRILQGSIVCLFHKPLQSRIERVHTSSLK
jgi:hypothetical protein